MRRDSDLPPSSRQARRAPHQQRGFLSALFEEVAPLDLRLVGRLLLHTALVGACAGAMACVFYYALEVAERLIIHGLAGYQTLTAAGEQIDLFKDLSGETKRPWLLLVLPALGATLASYLARRYAPECAGPGVDATIMAFHQKVSEVRRRVMWLKPLTTVLTLGTGGAGGREGPTMQMGGSIGSAVARLLKVSPHEQRILLVAGMAAGTSAIFRTPLGAALLAVEVLYRDDFEADALIPAVLASVVGYSVFISVYGDTTLFATASHYNFVIWHLLLYALMALIVSAAGALFVRTMRWVERLSARVPIAFRASLGGLVVGALAVSVVLAGHDTIAMGILGGGYGAAQGAITGASWLGDGWNAVGIMVLLAGAKIVAASFTVSTGGSAGAFAPSLAIGALLGGAFGRLAQLVLNDPSIEPGAFALVGMGTLFGGIAHAPLGALIMVCEMAGSYDLLVPLMLAEGIAFVATRRTSLYRAQPAGQQDSPAHPPRVLQVLSRLTVAEIIVHDRPFTHFRPGTPVTEVMHDVAQSNWQDVFPIIDKRGTLLGMITPELLRLLAGEQEIGPWLVAADAMQSPVAVRLDDDLRVASERMLAHGLRELLVIDDQNQIKGFVDEAEISQVYLEHLQV